MEEPENLSSSKKKTLLAPILAIALALSLFGATYYFPQSMPAVQSPAVPQATPSLAPLPSTASSYASAATPEPTTMPMPAATATPAKATSQSSILLPVLSVVAAIVIAIIAVLLLFSERGNKSDP